MGKCRVKEEARPWRLAPSGFTGLVPATALVSPTAPARVCVRVRVHVCVCVCVCVRPWRQQLPPYKAKMRGGKRKRTRSAPHSEPRRPTATFAEHTLSPACFLLWPARPVCGGVLKPAGLCVYRPPAWVMVLVPHTPRLGAGGARRRRRAPAVPVRPAGGAGLAWPGSCLAAFPQ